MKEFDLPITGLRERLDLVEAQLAILSERAGVPYQRPSDGVSPRVLELVAQDMREDAVKELRSQGLSVRDAINIVERL
jgi:uncharacterized protein YoaH (UPF0181 family)